MRAQPVYIVAVGIDLRHQRWIFEQRNGRLDCYDAREVVSIVFEPAVIEKARIEDAFWAGHTGNIRKIDLLHWDQAAVVKPRVTALWRQGTVCHPLLQGDEERPYIISVGIRIRQLLADPRRG